MNFWVTILLKFDEMLLTSKKETLYLIDLVIVAVLTDTKDLESEKKAGRVIIKEEIGHLVDSEELDLIYKIFHRKLEFYKDDDAKYYRLKQNIIDLIINQKRTRDAALLKKIYIADGMEQKQETDVLKRLQKIL